MIIYKTTNLKNGKIYVGKDKYNDPLYLGSGDLLGKAIKKYGRDMFRKEIIEECCASNINEREKFWINFYKSRDRGVGYNIAEGGTGGDTISKHPNRVEIGLRHSIAMTGKTPSQENRKPCSVETKLKLSKASSGERNPMFGKTHNDLTKQKISAIQRNRDPSTRVVSSITKQKISKANIGKIMTRETKQKISEANSGERNGFYGKKHTIENIEICRENGRLPKSSITRKRISESLKGTYHGSQNKVFIANGIEFKSLGQCFKLTNEPIHIIRGKLKTGIYFYVGKEV